MTEAFTDDLNRYLKSTEDEAKAQERAMKRMDAKDYTRAHASNAIFTCPAHRWDALQSALASHDSLEAGRQIDNIFYEYLLEKDHD